MVCPKCRAKIIVIDTVSESNRITRRRKCVKCSYRFFTEETIIGDKTPEGFFKKRQSGGCFYE